MISDHGTQFATAFTAMLMDKTLEDRKGKWLTELPQILWAIRTTVRGPTKEIPFLLYFRSKPMSSVEIRFWSSGVLRHSAQQNEVNRLVDLDFLEERQLEARMQMINYKQKAKEHHDKRVNPRTFSVGDLVLRKIAATGRKPREGKLGPNWEGPFFITRILREGTYRLSEKDGTPIPNPWHTDHLKKYYV